MLRRNEVKIQRMNLFHP